MFQELDSETRNSLSGFIAMEISSRIGLNIIITGIAFESEGMRVGRELTRKGVLEVH